jgi:subtilisin family serine protease
VKAFVRLALLGAGLALVALGAATPAAARERAGILSPRLAQLAAPRVGGFSDARQARAVGLPAEGAGSLQRDGRRVLVEMRFEAGVLARLDDLRRAGAEVLAASSRYQMATVAVKPGQLPALSAVPGAVSAGEVLAPVISAAPCQGAVVSEGDPQLAADTARADFGVDGSGVTVGIISDSFDADSGALTNAHGDELSGDLPGPVNPCGNTAKVNVLAETLSPSLATDEGRAMAQIVHDIAPGAAIDFATAEGGEIIFAQNIRALAKAGADVIVDDISYFEEPFFQDGPVAVAIDETVAEGIPYLTSAGNDNLENGENGTGERFASWETPGPYRDSPGCPPHLEAISVEAHPDHCLDFNPSEAVTDETFAITVEPHQELIADVQWTEPWFGVRADLDAYLLDSAEKPISGVGGTSDSVGKGEPGEGEPFEVVSWQNTSASPAQVKLAIDRCFSSKKQQEKEEGGCNPFADDSAMPGVKVILLENGRGVSATEYQKSLPPDVVGPTVYGHSGAAAAITVGAVPVTNSHEAERYTSRGPVKHLFGPVVGKAPAAALPPAEQTIAKPDLAASDCGRTTFFVPGPSGIRFCGTSAAAPHAAGVVALARQANPSATISQLRAGLAATAKQVGPAFGVDVVGAGLIDAHTAIDEIALPPKISFVNPVAATNDSTPSIAFTANRPVTFSCSLDGAPLAPCSSPFTPEEPLPDGPHGLLVQGIDLSGRIGARELPFVVDTVPPRTFFLAHPRRNLRTHGRGARAVFRFGSNDAAAGFICRVDGGLFRFCARVLSRRFGPGVHTVRVKAFDQAGNVDPTAAVYRFRVRRLRG